jgi:hypothetical protein
MGTVWFLTDVSHVFPEFQDQGYIQVVACDMKESVINIICACAHGFHTEGCIQEPLASVTEGPCQC